MGLVMDRLTLTTEQAAFLAAYRSQNGVNPADTVQEGTNLVVDDHLRIDGSWNCIAVRGASGVVDIYVPEWGDFIFPCDVVPWVTDRAGPNGETMPIMDEQQLQAMAAKAGGTDPQRAAAKDERERRRSLQRALRIGIASVDDGAERQRITKRLRELGVLGSDEKPEKD